MKNIFLCATTFLLINTELRSENDSQEAKDWDSRQELVSQLSKNVDRTLRTNSRAVRRGAENPRVNNLLKSQVDQINSRLKNRKLGISVVMNSAPKTQFQLTTPELEQVLNGLNPYQRDFAESAFQTKRIMGRLLHITNLSFEGPIPEGHKALAIDLENPAEAPKELKETLEKFSRAKGKNYIALFTDVIPLPDPSYSLKSEVVVEQKSDGEIAVYHQRIRNRSAGKAFAQVYTELPPALLLIRKSELLQPVKRDLKISHSIIDTYDTTVENL